MRYNVEEFTEKVERELTVKRQDIMPFAQFLEDKMDEHDYSNTSLARKVFHRVEKEGLVSYVPVTRQAIGAWLRGSMPSSREIYITLGMAFHMSLDEINHILLETYMGYGLYCKNIDDTLWIALINGLFSLDQMEEVRANIEEIIQEKGAEDSPSLLTTDLWVILGQVTSLPQLYDLIKKYRDEFANGARRFGQCLDEVVEEEYGYYDTAKGFLRDIGCLHYEAQFSKIRAGKAVVTREWLLRFLIALQPGYDSIEKLLKKAQMAPLGVTPTEVILEIISKEYTSNMSNSQEIWQLLEACVKRLREKGYEIPDDLGRKYKASFDSTVGQKWYFSLSIASQILKNEESRDFGYEKAGYCRYCSVDRLLFDDWNRMRKNRNFKNISSRWEKGEEVTNLEDMDQYPEFPSLAVPRGSKADVLELEKFQDYCYQRRPSRFSKDFLRNDAYYYVSLLYSVFTGCCFQKEETETEVEELCMIFDQIFTGDEQLKKVVEAVLMDTEHCGQEASLLALFDLLCSVRARG